MPQHA